jgi:hypothetical protein
MIMHNPHTRTITAVRSAQHTFAHTVFIAARDHRLLRSVHSGWSALVDVRDVVANST